MPKPAYRTLKTGSEKEKKKLWLRDYRVTKPWLKVCLLVLNPRDLIFHAAAHSTSARAASSWRSRWGLHLARCDHIIYSQYHRSSFSSRLDYLLLDSRRLVYFFSFQIPNLACKNVYSVPLLPLTVLCS